MRSVSVWSWVRFPTGGSMLLWIAAKEPKCSGGGQWRAHPDLNQGPADLQSAALTTELCTQLPPAATRGREVSPTYRPAAGTFQCIWPGSIWRPSACEADVIATRPWVLAHRSSDLPQGFGRSCVWSAAMLCQMVRSPANVSKVSRLPRARGSKFTARAGGRQKSLGKRNPPRRSRFKSAAQSGKG